MACRDRHIRILSTIHSRQCIRPTTHNDRRRWVLVATERKTRRPVRQREVLMGPPHRMPIRL